MTEGSKYRTVIVEGDQERATRLVKLLERGSYAPSILPTREEMLKELAAKTIPLIVLGETEDGFSPYELMHDVVRRSPMTSMILITDETEEDVEEKAEGYGILGHVGSDPGDEFFTLLDNFEKISGALTAP